MTNFHMNEEQEQYSESYEISTSFLQETGDAIGSLVLGPIIFAVCVVAAVGLLMPQASNNNISGPRRSNPFLAAFFGLSGIAYGISSAIPMLVVADNVSDMVVESLTRLLLGCFGIAGTLLVFTAIGLLPSVKRCTSWTALLISLAFTALAVIFNNQYIIVIFQFLAFPFAAVFFGCQESVNDPNKNNKNRNERINATKVVGIVLLWVALMSQFFFCAGQGCEDPGTNSGPPHINAPRMWNPTGGLILYQVLSLIALSVWAGAEVLLPSLPITKNAVRAEEQNYENQENDDITLDMSTISIGTEQDIDNDLNIEGEP